MNTDPKCPYCDVEIEVNDIASEILPMNFGTIYCPNPECNGKIAVEFDYNVKLKKI